MHITKPTKSLAKRPPFLVFLTSKLYSNQLQAQVAPNGWRTYSANLSNPMSHLFLTQVNPPNHMRAFPLVSLTLKWLGRNPQRNHLLILLHPAPQSSLTICLLDPLSPTLPTPLPVPPPSTPTLVPSPEIPPIFPKNPTASTSQSQNEAQHEFTDLQLTLMIP
ncbi:hypothetical protein O181_098682 [Austropuccinia psidii MF-1]|uniref:Uncharacterized protein n=1 Tax=Austropuccinia psidii MF-1 TaxID=1389203 RepID=A0A9Q3PFS4_9BASI|nr:hypothetical protein [Austropuccinia psidii MF-1]